MRNEEIGTVDAKAFDVVHERLLEQTER
jgi:hypothetical protein